MVHTSSFDITNADAYFNEMVLPQYENFIKRNSSSRHALLTTILLYHMYEWVHKRKFREQEFKTTYPDHSNSDIDRFAFSLFLDTREKHCCHRTHAEDEYRVQH